MSKGVIFDIRRFSVHDGPGIRTTVFMKGCPLSCWWCHNPESRDGKILSCDRKVILDGREFITTEIIGKEMDVEDVMKEVRRDKSFYEQSAGGVIFSGGEPLFQPDFLKDLLIAAKNEGFHTAVDTSGHAATNVIMDIIPYTDLFLYDIKLADEVKHFDYTGVSNELIIKNLSVILNNGKKVTIRIPLIPDITDTETNISGIMDLLSPLKPGITAVELLPWHELGEKKYSKLGMENKLAGIKSSPDRKELLKAEFQRNGFQIL